METLVHRFQKPLLWKPFSKRCGFDHWKRRIRVDWRPIRTKIAAFLKRSGYVWTRPKYKQRLTCWRRRFLAGRCKEYSNFLQIHNISVRKGKNRSVSDFRKALLTGVELPLEIFTNTQKPFSEPLYSFLWFSHLFWNHLQVWFADFHQVIEWFCLHPQRSEQCWAYVFLHYRAHVVQVQIPIKKMGTSEMV